MTWIVLCQEVIRDGRTGEEVSGNLVGIRSDCEILEFASLDEAATTLAASAVEVRFEVPDELGWRRWRDMPLVMKTKFIRLVEAKRNGASGRTVPVGMVLAKMRPTLESESGWSILFVAKLSDGEHAAPDLDGLADIVAPMEGELTTMPENRREGVYDLPGGWHKLLIRLIEARRIATAAIERAQR